ncbi:glyceraldehyde-3-phosphate dehydrogenase-like family protein [Wolffia australiana]
MKRIPIVVAGCGGVGRQLLEHIVNCRALHSKQGLALRVVGVCDSQSMLVTNDIFADELNDDVLTRICVEKTRGSSLSALGDIDDCQVFDYKEATMQVIDIAGLLGRSTGLVVVDCTASSETLELLKQAIDSGCCVVLANKKPLTSTIEDYEKLTAHVRRIRYESTVGAGLPIIASVTRVVASGDSILRIVGSLSGTLGYVMSEVETGRPLSEVVREAKRLGYTEPDPRDDLSGTDVARKALILARLVGWKINLDDIKVESLYPEDMAPGTLSTEEFLSNGLPLLDNDIGGRVRAASLNDNVLRYVCFIENSRVEVGLRELPKSSSIGRLRGSDNVVEIYSRCYRETPLVIQGAGAGNDTTAAGVLADLVDIQDLFK